MSPSSTPAAAAPKKRRRPAVVCQQCRRRKVACDRKWPCGQCILSKSVCQYSESQQESSVARKSRRRSASDSQETSVSQSRGPGNAPFYPSPADDDPPALVDSLGQRYPTVLAPNAASGQPARGQGHHAKHSNSRNLVGHLDAGLTRFQHRPPRFGHFEKSRLYGQSHWMNGILQFSEISKLNYSAIYGRESTNHETVQECKRIARSLKNHRQWSRRHFTQFRAFVPPKEVAIQLIDAYFRASETVFRVLHRPTFDEVLASYWQDPSATCDMWVINMLLVMAIGACFYSDDAGMDEVYREQSASWIFAAQVWLNAPVGKQHMNVGGVQAHCLLLVAQLTCQIGGDLTWVAAGPLLRSAMMIGLHREPSYFPNMSVLDCEIRRRLWATILEIALQSSLDSTLPPLISLEDYDCNAPSNVNDDEIDKKTELPVKGRALQEHTETTTQCLLVKSFPVRLKIVQALNDLHRAISYDELLHISSELTQACKFNSNLFRTFLASAKSEAERKQMRFQISIIDLLVRRFLLSLHGPSAQSGYERGCEQPKYYYSRKVCLESSLLLLSYQQEALAVGQEQGNQDLARLQLFGRGLFKNITIHASTTVALELLLELQEDSAPPTSSLPRSNLFSAIEGTVELARRRVAVGETSVKTFLFFASALALIKAKESGTSGEQAVRTTSRKCLDESLDMLRARAATVGAPLPGESTSGGDHGGSTATASADTPFDVATTSSNQPFAQPWSESFGPLASSGDATFGLASDWLWASATPEGPAGTRTADDDNFWF